jgi:hypothetical protein
MEAVSKEQPLLFLLFFPMLKYPLRILNEDEEIGNVSMFFSKNLPSRK